MGLRLAPYIRTYSGNDRMIIRFKTRFWPQKSVLFDGLDDDWNFELFDQKVRQFSKDRRRAFVDVVKRHVTSNILVDNFSTLFLLDIVDIFISILEVSEISVFFSFRQHNAFYLVIIQRIVTSCPQPDALSRDAGYTIVLYLKICNWCHRRHYTWHRFIRFIYGMFKIIMWDSKIGPCIWF